MGLLTQVRYAMATLIAPWLAVIALPLEIVVLTYQSRPWQGDGTWAIEWMAIPLFIIGTFLAGAVAIDAARLTTPTRLYRAVRPPAPLGELGWAWSWAVGPVIVVHLLAVSAALLSGNTAPPRGGWGIAALEVLVQLLVLASCAAIGSMIGRFLTPVVAGVVAVLVAFVLNYAFGPTGPVAGRVDLFGAGGSNSSFLGWTWNTPFLAIQAAGLLVLTIAALATPVSVRSGISRPGSLTALAGVLVIVAIGAPALVTIDRFRDTPGPPTRCFWYATVVCVYPEHAYEGEAIAQAVGELAHAAQAHGLGSIVKQTVAEASLSYQPPKTESSFVFPDPSEVDLHDPRALKTALVGELAYPSHCPQLASADGPGMRFGADLESLEATWLAAAGVQQSADDVAAAGGRILTVPQARDIIDRFNSCDPAEFQ